MNKLEFVMEMFDLSVRRLANGNKIRVVLETSEDLELEKKLIEFRGDNVKAIITQSNEPENKSDKVFIESSFEVFDIKCRRLRNGDKLCLILEKMYEKSEELSLVKMRADDVAIFMERIDMELPGINQDDEDDDIDLHDPSDDIGEDE